MTDHTRSADSTPRSLAAVIALAAVVVLVAPACGESNSDGEARQYADSLCTSISGWEQKVMGIAASLQAGNPSSVARAKLHRAATATSSLVSEIRGLDMPGVDGADEAKQNVDRFVADSESTVGTVKDGAAQLAPCAHP